MVGDDIEYLDLLQIMRMNICDSSFYVTPPHGGYSWLAGEYCK